MPLLRPVTTQGLPGHVWMIAPGLTVTEYPVTAEPPSLGGPSNVTVSDSLPCNADTLRGAPGVVAAVTGLDGSDSAESPTSVVACTVKVYESPLVSPVMVQGLAAQLIGTLPGDTVTV